MSDGHDEYFLDMYWHTEDNLFGHFPLLLAIFGQFGTALSFSRLWHLAQASTFFLEAHCF
jgi:hypothetical protein